MPALPSLPDAATGWNVTEALANGWPSSVTTPDTGARLLAPHPKIASRPSAAKRGNHRRDRMAISIAVCLGHSVKVTISPPLIVDRPGKTVFMSTEVETDRTE